MVTQSKAHLYLQNYQWDPFDTGKRVLIFSDVHRKFPLRSNRKCSNVMWIPNCNCARFLLQYKSMSKMTWNMHKCQKCVCDCCLPLHQKNYKLDSNFKSIECTNIYKTCKLHNVLCALCSGVNILRHLIFETAIASKLLHKNQA